MTEKDQNGEERTYECVRCQHAYTIGYMSTNLTLCAGCRADIKRGIVRRSIEPLLERDRRGRTLPQ